MTIFDLIGGILFTKKKNLINTCDEESQFSPYLVNRWLSMYSPETAKTSNVINKYIGIFDNKLDLYNFFVAIFPRVRSKRIQYFKKNKKEEVEEDKTIALLANRHELSIREISSYLAFLKK